MDIIDRRLVGGYGVLCTITEYTRGTALIFFGAICRRICLLVIPLSSIRPIQIYTDISNIE
jgi:hypothetical protein